MARVEVAYCPQPGVAEVVALELPAGTTVGEALSRSGLLSRHGLAPESLKTGIWSQPCDLQSPLRDRDRVEIYRPLLVDPKEARRQRYKRHKSAKAA